MASKKISAIAATIKMPAMPCVSHGTCCENQVVGAGCGTIGGVAGRGELAAAPRGNAEAAADGTALPAAVATIRRGFIAASSLRPHPPNGLHRTPFALRRARFARGCRMRGAVSMTVPRGSEARGVPESRMYGDPFEAIVPIKKRGVWRELARSLSTIFNPFLTAFALFAILAHIGAKDTLEFWRLLFVSTFFVSVGPMLYVFWLNATDRISDLDMSLRVEREMVFTAFVMFDILGAATLWLIHAPRLMIAAML